MTTTRVALLAATLFIGVGIAVGSAAIGPRVFYLSVKPYECLLGAAATGNKGNKTVLVVPCSDPAHDFEVYGVGHGGWGHSTPPPLQTELLILRNKCWALYQRVTGHPLQRPYGWEGFVPDPGTETAAYGDKIVCSLKTYPVIKPLGAGWHLH